MERAGRGTGANSRQGGFGYGAGPYPVGVLARKTFAHFEGAAIGIEQIFADQIDALILRKGPVQAAIERVQNSRHISELAADRPGLA